MNNIEIIDRYTVRFYKHLWTVDEVEIAECLWLRRDQNLFYADIRKVEPYALHSFMVKIFPKAMTSPGMIQYRTQLGKHLRKMYNDSYGEFIDNYYSKTNYPKELYVHQKRSLSYMLHKQYNLLSFEQGLGKTITAATISKVLSIPRTIIICPSLVKWNWFHDMTGDWGFNELYWTIIDANKSKSIYAFRERFVVINYEMVQKHLKYLTKDEVGHIIIDECHMIKNHKTKTRYKPIDELVKAFPKARVTLLSGTPVTNRVNDLFSYCKLTKHPLGKNFTKFKDRYTITSGMRGNKVIGSKNLDDLRLRMSNFMIRKKTEECLDLPKLIINKYYFEVGEFKQEYDQALEEFYNSKKRYDLASASEKGKASIEMKANIHTLNRLAATAKVSHISGLVDKLWNEGRKAIVFAGYKAPLHELQQIYGDKCVMIDGSVPAHKRQQMIDKFKTDPNCHVFIGNFRAAGIGINLVNAKDVIFMNFPFTPDLLEQPYKRAHRIGQTENVNVYYTIGKDTIDEHIFEMIVNKTQDINNLVDKDRKGVVHYNALGNMMFSKLVQDYEKKAGLQSTQSGFVSVK
ncbi:MAG: hypothetical protein COB15_09605 [Flavobacteriales bacterium]|nr:MAG: hypothetical protein COB15_09605 [Flavobacteriales bacterium]